MRLVEIITSADDAIRNRSLDEHCAECSLAELLAECEELEHFRRRSSNLYERVRALFFLYAIHRFHLPRCPGLAHRGLIPFHGYANLLVLYLGAEGAPAARTSLDGAEALQFVYRMQPNAITAVHHHTFSHYTEPLDAFVEPLGRTIYDRRLRILREGESFEK